VLSFDCQVCGPVRDNDDGDNGNDDKKAFSFRADLRCETCGLLTHESVGNHFRLKPSMV
jgi:rubredoxin